MKLLDKVNEERAIQGYPIQVRQKLGIYGFSGTDTKWAEARKNVKIAIDEFKSEEAEQK